MSDIHDKIRALLATANDERGNDNERANAERIASMLMMRHGIKQDELGEKAKVVDGEKFEIAYKWYRFAASAAAELYGVEPFYTTGGPVLLCRFIGRPENIEAAQDTLAFYLLQVEALYKANLPKGLSKKERSDYRKTFKDQCAYRIYERVLKIVKEQTQATAGVSHATALVVLEHREQLKLETKDHISKMSGVRSMKGVTVHARSANAYLDGRRAGDVVDLNRKVNARTPLQIGRG